MGTKLCFSCFSRNSDDAAECGSCGVKLLSVVKETNNLDIAKEHQISTSNRNRSKIRESFIAKSRARELYWIALITSFLGLLQIYTAGILDLINAISPVFGIEKVADGLILTISGFIYFSGIIPLYLRYSKVRMFYLIGNFINLYILYRIYGVLFVIPYYLSSDHSFDLPSEVQLFLSNIDLFKLLMFMFGFLYVLHTVMLFKKELLGVRFR